MEDLNIEDLGKAVMALQKQVLKTYNKVDSQMMYNQIMKMDVPFKEKLDNCIIIATIILNAEIEMIAMKRQPDLYSFAGVPYDRIIP
jgi:hypothetical protein